MAYFLSEPAPGKPDLTAKNRVGGFFCGSVSACLETRRAAVEAHRKNYANPRETASGIPFWLSRDPIEEEGGLNLYVFTYNDPIVWNDDMGNEPKQQSEQERVQRSIDNSNGKNANKTVVIADRANKGGATLDEAAARPTHIASAAAGAIGMFLDWKGDLAGLALINAKDKACAELGNKRKKELGWTGCDACCVTAFIAPKENLARPLTNRIIRDDITYLYYAVYEGKCKYGAEGSADKLESDLGVDKANRSYIDRNGELMKIRYALNDIKI